VTVFTGGGGNTYSPKSIAGKCPTHSIGESYESVTSGRGRGEKKLILARRQRGGLVEGIRL
jgi:hypothetical protein